MSQLNWLGRFFGNRFPVAISRRFRKPVTTTKLGLNHLPGRDGPSLLTGVEVNLLSGLSAGTAFANSANGIEAILIGVESSVGKSVRSPSTNFIDSETAPTTDSSAMKSESGTSNELLPSSFSVENATSAENIRYTSFNSYLAEPARLNEALSHTGGEASRNLVGNVDGTMAPRGIAVSAVPLTISPTTPRIDPVKPSSDTGTVVTKSSPTAFGVDSKVSFAATGRQFQALAPALTESAPETSISDPSSQVSYPGLLESAYPGIVTATPPIFVDGNEVIGGARLSESEAPPKGALPSLTTEESPSVTTSGQTSGQTTGQTPTQGTESNGGATFTPTNTEVTPRTDTVGRPLAANTELFRISGSPEAGSSLEVRYTLAAHNANGTVSVEGSATITSASVPAIISAGPALAGRSPDIITIQLKDMASVRLVKSTGTLFLTPPGERVGDSALFEAHRMGKSPEAFEQLVQRHSPAVLRACQRIIGNRADAEDVTQFVFLTLAQWQLRFPGTLTGWLHTVARNASYALLRSKSRRQRHEREAAKPEMSEPADSPSMTDDGLDSALSQLPAPLEEAVRLRYLEGWSQQEAAQIVGCPRGTLSRRAAHGIETLRELLGAQPAAVG